MKKSELLALSVAMAGSAAAMMPQTAAADACNDAGVGSNYAAGCTIASGSYLAEDIIFAGSKGVELNYTNDSAYFAACGWHVQGKNSFGMTTNSSEMTVRVGTGTASVDASSGCS